MNRTSSISGFARPGFASVFIAAAIFQSGCGSSSGGAESNSTAAQKATIPIESGSSAAILDPDRNSGKTIQPAAGAGPGIGLAAPGTTSGICAEMIPGPPVGLACLHCGAPGARENAFRLAEIMARSCRANLAMTMLVDGSFDDVRDQLGDVVRRATANGAKLHLYLYFSNGPWQRRIGSVPKKGIGSDITPEEFRRRISRDKVLQNIYFDRINWALPLITYSQTRGASVYVLPMLEDNFDQPTARTMEALVSTAIPDDIPIHLGRNPCPGCYAGNDESIPSEIFRDLHLSSPHDPITISGGVVTNDGANLHFAGENPEPRSFSFDQMKQAIARATANGNSFVIWRSQYQGIGADEVLLDPAVRSYPVPTAAEEAELVRLLTGH